MGEAGNCRISSGFCCNGNWVAIFNRKPACRQTGTTKFLHKGHGEEMPHFVSNKNVADMGHFICKINML